MNILFLSGHLPSPRARQGGQKTSYHICEFLGRTHAIHLLCFANENERAAFDGFGMGVFRSCDIIPVTHWTRFCGAFSSARLPLSVAARSSRAFRSRLRRLLRVHRFDVVILDHTAMWQYANEFGSPILCGGSAHDVLSQLWDRRASQAKTIWQRSALRFEANRIRRWEQKALSRLDFVVPHNPKDGALLREQDPSIRQFVIHPWVSVRLTEGASCLNVVRQPHSIGFLGAFDRHENADAIAVAVREILPRVRAAVSDFHFFVAGSYSETIATITDGAPNVTRVGFVDDIGSFLSGIQIALLPLRQGAGIKIKTLECMAAGLAVVTTPVGAEGISAQAGVHLLVCKSADELVNATTHLLRAPGEAKRMGESARAWFASEYDFDRPMQTFESYLVESTPTDVPGPRGWCKAQHESRFEEESRSGIHAQARSKSW